MTKQQIQKWFSTLEPVRFYYAGKWYAFFRASNGSFLYIFEVEDENYKFITTKVYQELKDYIASSKLLEEALRQEIAECLLYEDICRYEDNFLQETVPIGKKKQILQYKKLGLIAYLTLALGSTSIAGINAYQEKLYRSSYPFYQEMLDHLEVDDRSVREILVSRIEASLTEEEKEKYKENLLAIDQYDFFIQRCEEFYEKLDDNSKRLFKDKIQKVKIRLALEPLEDTPPFYSVGYDCHAPADEIDGTIYFDSLYHTYDYPRYCLELSLCAMLEDCNYQYSSSGRYYASGNSIENPHERNYVNFSYYNSLLFLSENYPEYTSELREILETEEVLYYQMFLSLLNPELSYLPFAYPYADICRNYLEVGRNPWQFQKFIDRLASFNGPDIELFSKNVEMYVRRNKAVNMGIDYFIERERHFIQEYFRIVSQEDLLSTDNLAKLDDLLLQELAKRYTQFESRLEKLNEAKYYQIEVYDRNELMDSYYEMLSDLYYRYVLLGRNHFSSYRTDLDLLGKFSSYYWQSVRSNSSDLDSESSVLELISSTKGKEKVKELYQFPLGD